MSNVQHQALFQSDLLKDEKIMWSGRPEVSADFTKADIFLIPFSLVWGGFILVWFGSVISIHLRNTDDLGISGASIMFFVIGTVFSFLGVYFVVGRYIYKRWKKRRTFYALTDRRALVLTLTFGRRIEGAFLDRLASINKSVRSSGIGTLHFGNTSLIGAMYANTGLDFFSGFYSGDVPTFYDVRDVDAVYDLVNRLR